jgi:hypothetical protein
MLTPQMTRVMPQAQAATLRANGGCIAELSFVVAPMMPPTTVLNRMMLDLTQALTQTQRLRK